MKGLGGMSVSAKFELPKFHYFRSGNPYGGSFRNFRFRIKPADDQLKLWAWPGPFCQDKTPEDQIVTAEFPLTEDGLREAEAWLDREEEAPRYH